MWVYTFSSAHPLKTFPLRAKERKLWPCFLLRHCLKIYIPNPPSLFPEIRTQSLTTCFTSHMNLQSPHCVCDRAQRHICSVYSTCIWLSEKVILPLLKWSIYKKRNLPPHSPLTPWTETLISNQLHYPTIIISLYSKINDRKVTMLNTWL